MVRIGEFEREALLKDAVGFDGEKTELIKLFEKVKRDQSEDQHDIETAFEADQLPVRLPNTRGFEPI